MLHHRRRLLKAASLAALAPLAATAQPDTLRIIVPFTASSGADISARVLADAITKTSGRKAYVENKPGGGNVIGSQELIRARPDGSTIMFTTGGHTTNAGIMKNLPYDSIRDFTPVAQLATGAGFALLVSSKSPYRSMEDYLAAARPQSGKLTYGSAGVGNTTHLMGVFFCKGTGIELLHVPFKGTPTAELVGGVIDSAFLGPSTVAGAIRSGQLRGLGISGAKRSILLPETPTFTELGLKVEDVPAWAGVFAPPAMSAEVLKTLYETILKAAQAPSFITHTKENGSEVTIVPPAPFKAYVDSEIERFRRVLPPLGIEVG